MTSLVSKRVNTENIEGEQSISTSCKPLNNKVKVTIDTKSISSLNNIELIELCSEISDQSLWDEFYHRFNKYIKMYVNKAYRSRINSMNSSAYAPETINDLIQDVYLKLLEQEKQALRSFKGESELSFLSYLSRISTNIVGEYFRKQSANKRNGKNISLDSLLSGDDSEQVSKQELISNYSIVNEEDRCINQLAINEILVLLEKSVKGVNSQRNLYILHLFMVDGMTIKQISMLPDINLKISAIDSILLRMRDLLIKILRESEFGYDCINCEFP